jgi:hypothetical protein
MSLTGISRVPPRGFEPLIFSLKDLRVKLTDHLKRYLVAH